MANPENFKALPSLCLKTPDPASADGHNCAEEPL